MLKILKNFKKLNKKLISILTKNEKINIKRGIKNEKNYTVNYININFNRMW